MAKGKKVSPYDTASCDEVFEGMSDFMIDQTGVKDVYNDNEAECKIIGLPLPSLACRYLLQSTIWPLSRFTQLVGEESSGKSSFMFEIMRWHRAFGGKSMLFETEAKDAPDLRKAIMRYDDRAVLTYPCSTIKDWQKGVNSFIDFCAKQFEGTKSAPGPGMIWPMCGGIDSLTAVTCEELNEEIKKEGFASIGYARDANVISKFMKVLPERARGMPISFIGTNHLKPGTDAQGRPTRNIPGGKALKFHETFEIEFKQISQWKRAFEQGYTVILKTRKNSLGPKMKEITVDVAWWYEPDPENSVVHRQQIIYDWGKASIDLLLDFFEAGGQVASAIKDIVDLSPVSGGNKGKLVWSRALGIEKDNPIPFRQAGALLEDRHDLLMQLYPLLGVKIRRVFEKGVCYQKQRDMSLENASVKLHEPVVNNLIWRPKTDESIHPGGAQ